MDTKKGIQNVMVSMLSKMVLLIAAIWVRRCIIQYLGNEINGLNSLFLNLLDVLSIAELGVGEAIIYSMYRPIVDNCINQIGAIYNTIKRVYICITFAILVAGLIMMPFLEVLTKDYQNAEIDLHLSFGLMLVSACITYLYGPESALFTAHKKQYIVTVIFAGGRILQYALQIVALVLTKSFACFLLARIASSVCQFILTKILARRQYGKLMSTNCRIDRRTEHEIRSNVGAMFLHKVGAVLVNSTDSILISAFIGIVELGKYANYTTIMTSMTGIIAMFFSPLTAVVGHLYVHADRKQFQSYFNFLHGFNTAVGMLFFLGYYAVIESLVCILFGENLELSKTITIVITINYFVQFSRKSSLLFRDATGLFYNDRWKPLVEGVINLILSWIFVQYWGIVGVLAATIITNMCICLIVEPYILHKYVFKASCIRYYVRNYASIVLFFFALMLLDRCMITMDNVWVQMIANGVRSIAISLSACGIIAVTNRDFMQFVKSALLKTRRVKTKSA